MADPETIDEAIEQNAMGPASVTVGNTSVTQKDIDQQIKADQHLKNQRAAASPTFGLRMLKMKPPGGG